MKKINSQNVTKQKGFTLIELVVVIVILGILAATAAPKFIDLQDDARTATLQAVKASMQSAATLVHSKSLIEGNADNGDTTVTTNAGTIEIRFGYPRSNAGTAAGNFTDLLDMTFGANEDFEISDTAVAGSVVIYPAGATAPTALAPGAAPNNCFTYYTEPTADGDLPEIVTVDCQ